MIVPECFKDMEDPAKDLTDDQIYKKMEERSAFQDLIGFGHAVNPWAKPGMQFYSTMVIGAGLITWLIMLIHGFYFKWYVNNNWQEGLATLIVFIAGIITLLAYGDIYYGFYVESYDLYMGRDWLMAKGMRGQMKRIRYDDISEVVAERNFVATKYLVKPKLFIKSRSDPKFEIRVNSVLIRFGEVIEHILERAENVTKVDVDEFAKDLLNDEVYKKNPDWEIINRAKMRAEENRKRIKELNDIK
jgi:hypothetical protein